MESYGGKERWKIYFFILEKKCKLLIVKLIVIILWLKIRRFESIIFLFLGFIFRIFVGFEIGRFDTFGDGERFEREEEVIYI